jgi:hypothetical protein
VSDPREVITAASLRASAAWTLPADAEILWQEEHDSAVGMSLDPASSAVTGESPRRMAVAERALR